MSLKREVSESVVNLRQTVKRLALEDSNLNIISIPQQQQTQHLPQEGNEEEQEEENQEEEADDEEEEYEEEQDQQQEDQQQQQQQEQKIEAVLFNSKVNFELNYEKLNEIGRGGFSIVYKCRNKLNNEIYAVKVKILKKDFPNFE